jgi:acetylornithine deacetylase
MLHEEAIELLKQLISIPSVSREEQGTADAIQAFLAKKGVIVKRRLSNVWAPNKYFDARKPILLLNSHHDTVKPNKSYTRNPHEPQVEDGKLFGLGSNDAGGALVSLLAAFLHYYNKQNLNYNLLFSATAEEEISGPDGIASVLEDLGKIDFAIVGEPTNMQMATAEKGVIVLDCIAQGKSGHAAREEGINAIYTAIPDIEWFKDYKFPKVSKLLGAVKMNVTIIKAGTQHNVIPDSCEFTVDVRVNECYTNEEVMEIIKTHVKCEVKARSLRLKSSFISEDHPIVKAGKSLGLNTYGSPTISDRALMPFPSLKMGPGDSARSHTADEFIYISEINGGIDLYIKVLDKILAA